jgi:hypothetical protein
MLIGVLQNMHVIVEQRNDTESKKIRMDMEAQPIQIHLEVSSYSKVISKNSDILLIVGTHSKQKLSMTDNPTVPS